jgi:GTP cyclohydrolase I
VIDVQNQPDGRDIDIDKVGVKNITYPIIVFDRTKGKQHTIATINMFVDLPRHFKGTHMSRFIEILNRYHGHVDFRSFLEILDELQRSLSARSATAR